MPWYHGTPDVREVRAAGFVPRHEPVRLVCDAQALAAARRHCQEDGIDAVESHRRMSALEEHFEHVSVPVPVFLAASRTTAATYANDRRAFDYQNAEPAVLEIEIEAEAELTIDAGRQTFRGLTWVRIAAGLREAGRDPEDVASTLKKRMQRDLDGRIRVAELGAALHLCGFRVVDVRNVVDTHEGKGHPDTVRMVFDPSLLRITTPGFDLRESGDLPTA